MIPRYRGTVRSRINSNPTFRKVSYQKKWFGMSSKHLNPFRFTSKLLPQKLQSHIISADSSYLVIVYLSQQCEASLAFACFLIPPVQFLEAAHHYFKDITELLSEGDEQFRNRKQKTIRQSINQSIIWQLFCPCFSSCGFSCPAGIQIM